MTSRKDSPETARRLGTQSALVLLGNVFTLVVGFPLQVYVSRVLGAAGLGQYAILEGAVNTANGFLNLGLAQTVVRFIPAHIEQGHYGYARRLLKIAVWSLLFVGIAAYLIMLAGLSYIERMWPNFQGDTYNAALIGLLLPLSLLVFLMQQALRGFHEIRYMVLGSSIVQLSVKAAVTVVLFTLGLQLSGYILASVLATGVAVVWMAVGLRRKLNGLPPASEDAGSAPVGEWRRYAGIAYSNSLLGAATAYIDRFLLGLFVGGSEVGVLLVIRQLQQIPVVFSQMLLVVGAPIFAAAYARNDAAERDRLYVLMTDWLMKASLPLMMFLFLFAEPVLELFGQRFAEDGVPALWILLAGQFINLACGPTGNVAMMSGLESSVLRLSAYNTVLNAVLLAALAPTLGLLGVAIATTAATVFINATVMRLLRRKLALKWWDPRFLNLVWPTSAALAVGVMVQYAGLGHGALALAVALLGMYAVFCAVVLLYGLNEDERDLLIYVQQRLTGQAGNA